MAGGSERVLVLGTGNPGKIAEMRRMLAGTDWRVEALPNDIPDYEETGDTFEANSRGKALYYSERTGLPALADDSGLEIDALGGEPGVYSARYIDPGIDQAERNRLVLARLENVADPERTARFVCHLSLAAGGRIVHETRGTCEGRIARQARGDAGFGYDPIFLLPELGKTFAEISREDKARHSHRGHAVRDMATFLTDWSPDDPPPGVS